MIYELHRGGETPRPFASLADAIEASGVPAICWNAVTATHPDEIATFHGLKVIRAPGVAAEFIAAERLAGRLPPRAS